MLTHHSQLEGVKEGHQGDKRPRACQNKTHLTVGHAVFQGNLERQNHYCFNWGKWKHLLRDRYLRTPENRCGEKIENPFVYY